MTHTVLVNSKIHYQPGRHGPGVMPVETLCDLTCFDATSSHVFGEKGLDAAFENEIARTSVNYSYSGTLQIMALASVLGVPIQTVYPDQNHKLFPIYENVFQPRQGCHSSAFPVRILWTNTRGWPDRSKEFVVNHFVPLFKQGPDVFRAQTTSTSAPRKFSWETKSWHVFDQRGQSKMQTEKQRDEQHNAKKKMQRAKFKTTESQGDKISGQKKGGKLHRKESADKETKKQRIAKGPNKMKK